MVSMQMMTLSNMDVECEFSWILHTSIEYGLCTCCEDIHGFHASELPCGYMARVWWGMPLVLQEMEESSVPTQCVVLQAEVSSK